MIVQAESKSKFTCILPRRRLSKRDAIPQSCASRAQKQAKLAILPRRRLSKRRLALRKVCEPSAKANRVHFAEGSVCRLADDRGGQEVRKPYFSGFRFHILIVISNFAEPSGLIVWK